ncbi:MAG: sigma-54 dependent transcriptional regulator [Planctomycetota bacterium]
MVEDDRTLAGLLLRHPVRAGLVGDSPALTGLFQQIQALAGVDIPVMILGEIGSGKENAARALHLNSLRSRGPFVVESGAALRGALVQRHLFGHTRGAFTGATSNVPGLLDTVDGGTLYLDEVAEISPECQALLLRVLKTGEYRPLGSPYARKSVFRLVSSTSCNLAALVGSGLFRRDLFYRLRAAVLQVPPLRDRRSDIPALADQVIRETSAHGERRGGRPVFTPEAEDALREHDWPGNVRELRNELLQAIALSDGKPISARSFRFLRERVPNGPHESARPRTLKHRIDAVEAGAIREVLKETGGNKAEAARRLGMTRRTLYRRLKRLRS